MLLLFKVTSSENLLDVMKARATTSWSYHQGPLFSWKTILPHEQVSKDTLWKHRLWSRLRCLQSSQNTLHSTLSTKLISLVSSSCVRRSLWTTSWGLWGDWCSSWPMVTWGHRRIQGCTFSCRLRSFSLRLFFRAICFLVLWLTTFRSRIFQTAVRFFLRFLRMFHLLFLWYLSFLMYQRFQTVKLRLESRCEGCCSFTTSAFQEKQKLVYAFMQLRLRQKSVVGIQGLQDFKPTLVTSNLSYTEVFCSSPSLSTEAIQQPRSSQVLLLIFQRCYRQNDFSPEFAIACRFPIESKVTENVLRLDHDVQDVMQLQVPLPGTRTLGAVKHPLVSREKAGPSPTLPQERAQLRYHVNPVAQNNQYG